jgi:hypothetical protein
MRPEIFKKEYLNEIKDNPGLVPKEHDDWKGFRETKNNLMDALSAKMGNSRVIDCKDGSQEHEEAKEKTLAVASPTKRKLADRFKEMTERMSEAAHDLQKENCKRSLHGTDEEMCVVMRVFRKSNQEDIYHKHFDVDSTLHKKSWARKSLEAKRYWKSKLPNDYYNCILESRYKWDGQNHFKHWADEHTLPWPTDFLLEDMSTQ